MNGNLEDYDEAIAEDYDESFDDESYDEPSEDLLGTIGNVLTGGLPAIASGIGSLFGNAIRPQPSRPPLPQVSVPAPSQGVTNAQLNTPAGSATIALPAPLVKQDEFREVTARLQEGINRNTSRLNTVTGDVTRLRTDFARIETDTRAQVAKLRTDTRKSLVRSRKEQAAAIARVRRDIGQQATTSMLVSMMMQQQLQRGLDEHTHPDHAHGGVTAGAANTSVASIGAASTAGSDNTAMMFLPMMMMGSQDGASGDNNMMMMMMMMALSR
jgi:hypothetical protein